MGLGFCLQGLEKQSSNFFGIGTMTQMSFQIKLGIRQETGTQTAVGGNPDPVATITEMVGQRPDKTNSSLPTGQ